MNVHIANQAAVISWSVAAVDEDIECLLLIDQLTYLVELFVCQHDGQDTVSVRAFNPRMDI